MKVKGCCIFIIIVTHMLIMPMTARSQYRSSVSPQLICVEYADQIHDNTCKFLCFRGKPAGYCKSFLITEAAYMFRISKSGYTESNNNKNFYFLGEIGYMWNLDANKAIGGTLYYGFDDDGSELAIKPRYRHWLNSSIHLDASIGVILWNFSDMNKTPGFIAQFNLGYGDYFSVFTQFNLKNYKDNFYIDSQHVQDANESERVWYAGLKLGSYPGSAAIVIAPLTILIWYLVAFSD